jgi:hypothetical protein
LLSIANAAISNPMKIAAVMTCFMIPPFLKAYLMRKV